MRSVLFALLLCAAPAPAFAQAMVPDRDFWVINVGYRDLRFNAAGRGRAYMLHVYGAVLNDPRDDVASFDPGEEITGTGWLVVEVRDTHDDPYVLIAPATGGGMMRLYPHFEIAQEKIALRLQGIRDVRTPRAPPPPNQPRPPRRQPRPIPDGARAYWPPPE